MNMSASATESGWFQGEQSQLIYLNPLITHSALRKQIKK